MFEPTTTEPAILEQWKQQGLRGKLKAKGKKSFYFLQGPPYTSGRLHIGHAWNHALKDMVLRYKRMTGYDVFDRAGYDMHGLPTETKVMAKHNLKDKQDVKNFGYERFAQECIAFCKENAALMNEDLKRLGVEMDFDNAYQPIAKDYTDGVWWLIKTLHQKGRLYEGFRTVYWDWEHESALSKHELDYKTVRDSSIFVRFPLRDTNNHASTSLIIWTTTPWTIPFNLAVMVNPELEYVYCEVDWQGNTEQWIVAKALAGPFIQSVVGQPLKIVKEVKGEALAGLQYTHPFEDTMGTHYREIAAASSQAAKHLHSVILSEDHVDTSAGTGLVHCAPGCGPEDFEVGWKHGLPAFNLLDEKGVFPASTGTFAGRSAIPQNVEFIKDLKARNALVAKTTIEHEYPHGQRSGVPVIFRATKQWFWKIEDLKDRMIEENNKTLWVPKAGYNAFSNWLENLRDNSITKQRFWGTAVPIWRADDGDYIVVGSIAELEQLSGQIVTDAHKPWIDDITITKNGKIYRRLPDVLDVWIDAGTASWNALGFPARTELFDKLYPADFICEGNDQIRGWFNLLMVASIAAFDKPAFKAVYMHGMLTDVGGVKMSKSLGNIISPYEIVDKYGADTLRYYFSKTKAGDDIAFSWDEVQLHNRNLRVLYNTVSLFIQTFELARQEGDDVTQITSLPPTLDALDRYILSRVHSALAKVRECFETYQLYTIPGLIDNVFLDISRVYVQSKRDALNESGDERINTLRVLYHALKNITCMLAPVTPFLAEQLYTLLKTCDASLLESVHLEEYPQENVALIDDTVVDDIIVAQEFIKDALYAREQLKRNVRFPLKEIIMVSADPAVHQRLRRVEDFVLSCVNAKKAVYAHDHESRQCVIQPNYKNLGKKFGLSTPAVAERLKNMTSQEYTLLEKDNMLRIDADGQAHTINPDDVIVTFSLKEGFKGTTKVIVPVVDDPQLDREGLAREFIRRLQDMRKKAGLRKGQDIAIEYDAQGSLLQAIQEHAELIAKKCNLVGMHRKEQQQFNETIKEFGCNIRIV